MGKITGFLEIERQERPSDKPEARINNYREFVHNLPAPQVSQQAARRIRVKGGRGYAGYVGVNAFRKELIKVLPIPS